MEDFDGVLMLGLYRDSTGSYMQTIVPREVVLTEDYDCVRDWAEKAFPEFDVIENVDENYGSRPCLDWMDAEDVIDWLTDIGCPE